MYRTDGQKLYEKVVERVKMMISTEVYKKGDMLPSEKELMDMTGVSRITVREALRILKETGIIETKQGKGSFVVVSAEELSRHAVDRTAYSKSFLEATQVLLLLEPEITRDIALHGTEEDFRTIEKALNDTSPAAERRELFHYALVKAAGNSVLEEIYAALREKDHPKNVIDLVEPSAQKTVSAEIRNQHMKVFRAIRQRDGEFAYFYMKEHLTYIYSVYEDYFRRF